MLDLNSEVLINFLLHQPKKGEVPHLTLSTKINAYQFASFQINACDYVRHFWYCIFNVTCKTAKQLMSVSLGNLQSALLSKFVTTD